MNPEAAELTALRHISKGEVTIADGGYVHHGCPITGALADALVRLHLGGYLVVGVPGPDRRRPVRTTAAGQARLAALGRRKPRG